jgi:hypothetical protein
MSIYCGKLGAYDDTTIPVFDGWRAAGAGGGAGLAGRAEAYRGGVSPDFSQTFDPK